MATFLTYATAPWRLVVLIGFGIGVLVYEYGKTIAALAAGYVLWLLLKLMVGEM